MSTTLNPTALKKYAADFSSKVLSDFFSDKPTITGPELLSLTPVRQVNLGIVNQLSEQWKSDARSFRSPYFDFGNAEVSAALQKFMNTVSQHILVKRDDLAPLLEQATREALQLLLAPSEYFEGKLRDLPDFTFNKATARQMDRFTHIHAGVVKHLELRLSDSGSEFVYVNRALNWLAEIMNSGASLDDPSPYIDSFSSVVFLDKDALTNATAVPVAAPDSESTPDQPTESGSFFDSALSGTAGQRPDPVAGDAPRMASVDVSREPSTEARPTSTGVNSLNSRFTVNTANHSEETNYGNVTLKVENLLGSVALGQRFMFVNQLFGRDSDAFDEAMRELDRASTLDEAQGLLTHKYAAKYRWDPNSEALKDLTALVKRKYR